MNEIEAWAKRCREAAEKLRASDAAQMAARREYDAIVGAAPKLFSSESTQFFLEAQWEAGLTGGLSLWVRDRTGRESIRITGGDVQAMMAWFRTEVAPEVEESVVTPRPARRVELGE